MSTHSRILVVEDEALVAADIEQRLHGLGYHVAAVVDSGEDAIVAVRSDKPDLALMDIRLRGAMSGIEAAEILRTSHDVPVVYLTSHADVDTLQRAGRTEPFGFIVKPFGELDLRATIETAFHRARAEQRVRNLERWLSVTLDSIGDGVIATDIAGRITLLNRSAEQLTGWKSAEALGLQIDEVFDVRQNESAFPTLQLVARTVDHGEINHLPPRLVLHSRDGRTYFIDDSVSPIRDAKGSCVGVVIVFSDRTEHEQMIEQQRQFDRKLQEAQKLESLGVLAGGIAHDFNNLLTGIVGNTSLAMRELPPDSRVKEYLADVELASQRAAELVRQMLAYSGRSRFVVQPTDLSELVRETAKLVSLSVSTRAALRFHLAEGLPHVSVDASQIRQVVMNLVINAAEAMTAPDGTIDITTRLILADRQMLDAAISAGELEDGHYVLLEVRDTGQGITSENLKRIFDPFFTTKFTGRGLGLAAVVGIVRGHHGALLVDSAVGRGTTFRVLLPVPPESTVAAASEHQNGSEATELRGHGCVLVIDDEPYVVRTTAHILRASGFEVDTVVDTAEGIAKFAANPSRYRTILLDLTMPHLDGLAAFRELRSVRPDIPVVLMSGYSESEATERFLGQGLAGFLAKPFERDALLAAVRKALE